jgi:hypothetical protein
MAKHGSKRIRRVVKKASLAGGAAVTATAMTLSLAPPSAAALPDVTLPPITDIPGVNVITTGPPFGLLGIVGLNPFWVPALPSRIADEINGTPYLGGTDLDIPVTVPNPAYIPGCTGKFCPPATITGSLELDLVKLRVPVVLAFGIGALAAGMAYPQVEADLPNQPGGTGPNAEPGSSVTIVPMILLRNPGRNDGGVAARFAPIFAIFGIDTATNDFDVQTDGTAVLVPVKLDATVQNDLLSDFAAWPNPVTLLNNAAAFAFPTYILRGSDLSGVGLSTLNPLVASLVGNLASAIIGDGLKVDLPGALPTIDISRTAAILAANPALTSLLSDTFPGIDIDIPDGSTLADRYEALNQYLTLQNGAQPVLEPFRYPTDLLSLVTGQTITNPFADAIEPAITMLGNLGYTNVVQYGADPNDFRDDYQRDFSNNFGSNGGEAMPFFSFPQNIKWGAVPADLVTALGGGVHDAFFYGGIPGLNNPPPSNHENPIGLVVDLLKDAVGSVNLGSLTDLQTVGDQGSATPLAANAIPDQNAQRIAVDPVAATASPTPPPSDPTEHDASANASAAPAATSDTSAAANTAERQRPRLGIWRGSMKPPTGGGGTNAAVGSLGKNPLRQAISDTRQQIRDTVGDLAKSVNEVTRHIAKAATGGGADDDHDTPGGES